MNNNPNSLSAISLAISAVLTEYLSANELNLLGLLLATIGDMLQLNAWEMSNNKGTLQ